MKRNGVLLILYLLKKRKNLVISAMLSRQCLHLADYEKFNQFLGELKTFQEVIVSIVEKPESKSLSDIIEEIKKIGLTSRNMKALKKVVKMTFNTYKESLAYMGRGLMETTK